MTVFKTAIKSYFQIPLLLLCIGGGLRNGGGLVWAYNTKAYFRVYFCNTTGVGTYLSWIPLVGGSAGAVVGGMVSDWLIKKRIRTARLWVLIGSQVCVLLEPGTLIFSLHTGSCCTVSYWCSLASSSMGVPHVAPSICCW